MQTAKTATTRRPQRKRWIFTGSSPPPGWKPMQDPSKVAYMVWQYDDKEDGTEIVRGYVRFHRRAYTGAVKRLADGLVDIVISKATTWETFCRLDIVKDTNRAAGPWEFGTYDGRAGATGVRPGSRLLQRYEPSGVGLQVRPLYEPVAKTWQEFLVANKK